MRSVLLPSPHSQDLDVPKETSSTERKSRIVPCVGCRKAKTQCKELMCIDGVYSCLRCKNSGQVCSGPALTQKQQETKMKRQQQQDKRQLSIALYSVDDLPPHMSATRETAVQGNARGSTLHISEGVSICMDDPVDHTATPSYQSHYYQQRLSVARNENIQPDAQLTAIHYGQGDNERLEQRERLPIVDDAVRSTGALAPTIFPLTNPYFPESSEVHSSLGTTESPHVSHHMEQWVFNADHDGSPKLQHFYSFPDLNTSQHGEYGLGFNSQSYAWDGMPVALVD
ncbi:hypothetical protein EW145_g1215 [Phellinidium pouzarii]|uniref:Zn(2)-C6 fungal-type domain-containing protein n=1 Tax=Phellinidium pouzarii TaxID=167371 RepID=A0A4S4LH78_9AGAM|nr:hypothetical protein EW145_g1215 [Phellinidium pouzarii]